MTDPVTEVEVVSGSIVPPLMLLASLLPALAIFALPERGVRTRSALNLAGAVAKVGLVVALVPPVAAGTRLEWRIPVLPGTDLVLLADPLALMFVALSSLLWLATTVYAIGYLEGSPHRSRFFGFFNLCVTATVGIALSGNLVTFLIFYELLTLVTYPLVAHRGTPGALAAARSYLTYTLAGGAVLLGGVVWLNALARPVEFTPGGVDAVAELARERPAVATTVFAVLVAGMGVKAVVVPLHSWLVKAMVAPAPVSALLHAVAVVKAGVFGIVRVVHDVFGVHVADGLGVLVPLAALAATTVVYGSLRALTQEGLKQRLAYSTVAHLAYVVLGISVVGEAVTTGGIVHIFHQGLTKITLFFCAGLFAEVLGLTKVGELAGVGRRMPLTCAAFTVAALGTVGLPPMASFVTKWQLGTGALEAGEPWVVAVLVVSTLLTAAYLLPVVYAMWVQDPAEGPAWASEPTRSRRAVEAPKSLVLPTVVVASLALAAGLAAGMDYSPLFLASLVAEARYQP